jgi:hypothetical protein
MHKHKGRGVQAEHFCRILALVGRIPLENIDKLQIFMLILWSQAFV